MRTIVTISGTSRPDNYTSKALAVVNAALKSAGATVSHFDCRELTLGFPGQPATDDAKTLEQAVRGCAGVVIATPEYHGTFAAMTKLVIENLGFPSSLKGKAVALLGVAAGRIGAIKSLEQLRGVCAHTGAVVMPQSVSIAGVRNAFSADGAIEDSAIQGVLEDFATSFARFIGDYVCPKVILEAQAREDGAAWTTTV
jgi:NAD(P)H-dependent FMN reductase